MKFRILKVCQWENLAITARFQPAVLAALCSLSLRQVERHFMRHFQRTPENWMRELRCRLARELIAEGWSNKAVAHELHFANESHLCHEFAHYYRDTPQAFSVSFVDEPRINISVRSTEAAIMKT
jgi:transcriptional regulator GlxA family with amidase domain